MARSPGDRGQRRQSRAGLAGRPVPESKAFIGGKDFQRLAKVVEGSENLTGG